MMKGNWKVPDSEGFSGGKPHSKMVRNESREVEGVPRTGTED
jgi:hypothetical protein